VRETADLLEGLPQGVDALLQQGLMGLGIGGPPELLEVDLDNGEHLADLVVELPGDPLPLRLLKLDKLGGKGLHQIFRVLPLSLLILSLRDVAGVADYRLHVSPLADDGRQDIFVVSEAFGGGEKRFGNDCFS